MLIGKLEGSYLFMGRNLPPSKLAAQTTMDLAPRVRVTIHSYRGGLANLSETDMQSGGGSQIYYTCIGMGKKGTGGHLA